MKEPSEVIIRRPNLHLSLYADDYNWKLTVRRMVRDELVVVYEVKNESYETTGYWKAAAESAWKRETEFEEWLKKENPVVFEQYEKRFPKGPPMA